VLPAQTTIVNWVVTKRSAPVQLCANDQIVSLPTKLLDCPAHALLTFASSISLRMVSVLSRSAGLKTFFYTTERSFIASEEHEEKKQEKDLLQLHQKN